MKEELYRKVYVKSETDCPKVEGDYFCNRSGFNSVQHLMTTLGKTYMREIRWYLQPIEQKESKGAEEIWEKHYKASCLLGRTQSDSKAIVAAMEEYRQPPQKVEQEEEKPTDEEIEKFVKDFGNYYMQTDNKFEQCVDYFKKWISTNLKY